jgi:Concanavalin A-like lectin/glucanases superfamily
MSNSGSMPIVFRHKWDEKSGFGLYTEWSAGKAVFGHYDSIGHKNGVQSEPVVQDGQWHHLAGTLQPAVGGGYLYRIYLHGSLDAEQIGFGALTKRPPREAS